MTKQITGETTANEILALVEAEAAKQVDAWEGAIEIEIKGDATSVCAMCGIHEIQIVRTPICEWPGEPPTHHAWMLTERVSGSHSTETELHHARALLTSMGWLADGEV